MKKITLCLMTICLSLSFQPISSKAETSAGQTTISVASTHQKEEQEILLQHLQAINAMDISDLSKADKRHLRTQVRSIKQQLRAVGGGVYISGGAIILIVILMIILL